MLQQPAATQFVIDGEAWEWFSGMGARVGGLTSLWYSAHCLLGCSDSEKVSTVPQPDDDDELSKPKRYEWARVSRFG